MRMGVQSTTGNPRVAHCQRCFSQLLPSKGISVNPSRDRLVEMLLQWIAAPASGNAQQASADQPAAAAVTELGGRLLNAIMSLYGVLPTKLDL